MTTEHVLTPDDRCPCGKPQTGSGYCSYECYSKHEPTPASMGGPLSEADRLAEIRRTLKMAKMASANAPGTFWHTFTENTEFLLELVGVLEGQLATAQRLLDEQRGATRVAASAADRFRDVLSEALGHPEDNPGDDVLVAELREHFGFSGPEPTRWRDFLTGARAQIDQIEADRTSALGLGEGANDA